MRIPLPENTLQELTPSWPWKTPFLAPKLHHQLWLVKQNSIVLILLCWGAKM
jgi:hypothetical protein